SAEQRTELQRKRLDYLQRDVASVLQTGGSDAVKKALDRIDVLRKSQQSNAQAVAMLDQLAAKIKNDAKDATTMASSQALTVYTGSFRPLCDEALRRRDLGAARKALN